MDTFVGSLFIRKFPATADTPARAVAHVQPLVAGAKNIAIALPSKAMLAGLGGQPSVCRPVEGIPGTSYAFGRVTVTGFNQDTGSYTGLTRYIDPNNQDVLDFLDGIGAKPVQAPAEPAPAQAPAEPVPSRT